MRIRNTSIVLGFVYVSQKHYSTQKAKIFNGKEMDMIEPQIIEEIVIHPGVDHGNSTEKCLFCGTWIQLDFMEAHTNAHLESGHCPHCEEVFPSSASLSDHVLYCTRKHPEISCCGQSYQSLVMLLRHCEHAHPVFLREAVLQMKNVLISIIQSESNPEEEREEEDEVLIEEEILDTDQMIEEEITVFKCELCHFTSTDEHEMTTHRATHKLPCNRCIFTAETKQELTDHRRELHLTNDKHACPFCEQSMWSKYNILQHILEKHKDSDFEIPEFVQPRDKTQIGPIHRCYVCRRKFETAESLAVHKKRHEKETPNVCEFCGVTFKYKRQHSQHVSRFHVNKEKYENPRHTCAECGTSFISEYILKTHLGNVHGKGAICFTCEECGKGFARINEFNSHKTKHSEEYPYECSDCQKKFKREHSLKLHRRNIHEPREEDQEPCILCEHVFKNKDFLRSHVRKVHKMSLLQAYQSVGLPYKGRKVWNAIERKEEIVINHRVFKVNRVLNQ